MNNVNQSKSLKMFKVNLIIIHLVIINFIFAQLNVIDDEIKLLHNKATMQLQLGNNTAAILLYKKIIKMQEDKLGPNSIELAKSSNIFGEILFKIGEIEMSRIYFDKAIQIYETIIINERDLLKQSLKNLKKIYELENHTDLITYTDSLIKIVSNKNGEPYRLWELEVINNIFPSDSEEDSASITIDKGLFYLENNLYSQASYHLSEGLLMESDEVTLEYLYEINNSDSLIIDKLISSFEYMYLNDTSLNSSLFYLSLLQINKDKEKSKNYISKYIADHYNDYRAYLHYGHLLFADNDWFNAMYNYQSSLLNKKTNNAYLGVGRCLLQLNAYDEALKAFKYVIKLDENNDEAYYYSGICNIKLTKYKEAIYQLTHSLMLNPKNEDIYYYLGLAYINTNNNIRALEALRRAINIDAENGEAYFLIGKLYEKILEIEKSTNNYLLAKKFNPENQLINYNLGMLYYRSNKLKLAMEPLREFIIFNPDSINVLKALGEIFLSEARYPEAIDTYKRLIKINPENISYYESIAQSYAKLKKYNKANNYYEDILLINNERVDIYFYLGGLALERNHIDDAIYYYHEALECGLDSYELYYQLGVSYGTIKNYEEAIIFFNKAKILNENIKINYNIGIAYYELDMQNKASKYLKNYISEYSDDDEALFYLGKSYFKVKEFDKSIRYLYDAYKINDNDNRIKLYIGLAHKNLQQYNDAAIFFKKILKNDYENINAQFELGFCYYKLNKNRESKKSLNALYMLDREMHDSLYYIVNSHSLSN